MAARVEAISRRADQADLDRRPRRLAAWSRFRARIRTTSIPCGSATRSISSPTATARSRCSTTTQRPKQVKQLIENQGLDFKSASAGPGAIVYEQFGALHLYDLKTGKTKPVEFALAGDLPELRPHSSTSPDGCAMPRYLAERRARGVCGARRDHHGARGKGRSAQPDQHARRDGARARVVAGRQEHRLLLRRIGRIRAARAAAERHGRGEEDRPG